MPNFDSGVTGYETRQAVVFNHFPIDKRGKLDLSCKQCKYFRPTYRTCGLTGDIVAFPEHNIGDTCPLEPVEMEVPDV